VEFRVFAPVQFQEGTPHEYSGTLEFNIDVADGIIRDIKIFGDYFNMSDTEEIENVLRNVQHSEVKIREALAQYTISDYFNNLTLDEFMEGMF
jgi:lipoate-protein ligase A